MLAATSAVVVWGASSVLIMGVEGLTGLGVACYRIWLGAIVVTIVFLASGNRLSWRLLRLSLLGGDGGGANILNGDLLAVGALLAWTAYFVCSKRARQELSAFEYLTGMAIVAAVGVVPLPFLFHGTLAATDANGWLTIVYITLINGLIGHFLMAFAHGHVTLLTMSLLTLAIPVFAAASAAVWIDEPLTGLQVGGMTVVLAALGLVSTSAARRAPALVEADVEAIEAAPHP